MLGRCLVGSAHDAHDNDDDDDDDDDDAHDGSRPRARGLMTFTRLTWLSASSGECSAVPRQQTAGVQRHL